MLQGGISLNVIKKGLVCVVLICLLSGCSKKENVVNPFDGSFTDNFVVSTLETVKTKYTDYEYDAITQLITSIKFIDYSNGTLQCCVLDVDKALEDAWQDKAFVSTFKSLKKTSDLEAIKYVFECVLSSGFSTEYSFNIELVNSQYSSDDAIVQWAESALKEIEDAVASGNTKSKSIPELSMGANVVTFEDHTLCVSIDSINSDALGEAIELSERNKNVQLGEGCSIVCIKATFTNLSNKTITIDNPFVCINKSVLLQTDQFFTGNKNSVTIKSGKQASVKSFVIRQGDSKIYLFDQKNSCCYEVPIE